MFGSSSANVAVPANTSVDFLTRRAMVENMASQLDNMPLQSNSVSPVPLEVQLHHLERVRLFQEMMRSNQPQGSNGGGSYGNTHVHPAQPHSADQLQLHTPRVLPLSMPHSPLLNTVGSVSTQNLLVNTSSNSAPLLHQMHVPTTIATSPYPTPTTMHNATSMRRSASLQQSLPQLFPAYHRPIPNYAFPKKLRHRRKGAELSRDFLCFADGCDKAYASDSALNNHLLTKHNIKRTRGNNILSGDTTPASTPETTPTIERRAFRGSQMVTTSPHLPNATGTCTNANTTSTNTNTNTSTNTQVVASTATSYPDDVSRVLAELSLTMPDRDDSALPKPNVDILRTYSPDVRTYSYGIDRSAAFSPAAERNMASRQRSNSLPGCHGNLFSSLAPVAEENGNYSFNNGSESVGGLNDGARGCKVESIEAWLLGLVHTSGEEFMNEQCREGDADALMRLQLELMMAGEGCLPGNGPYTAN